MDYVIGVDAGGTKTNAALYDDMGRVVYETRTGHGNITVDAVAATNNIAEAVSRCADACPAHEKIFIYIGAAGIAAEGNAQTLTAKLETLFPNCPVRVENDAILALYALTKGKDGILVIAGTGAIAYGKYCGKQMRAGGWGHILGDEGSGYYISRRAFSNVTNEYDAGAGYGRLSKRLLEKLGTDVFGMIKYVYSASKSDIAGFLPIVVQAAADGDRTAASLLTEAGCGLSSLAKSLYTRLECTGRVAVVVKGGVLEGVKVVKNEFIRGLPDDKFYISQESAPSESGAYYMHYT